jgi:hypothetical protein
VSVSRREERGGGRAEREMEDEEGEVREKVRKSVGRLMLSLTGKERNEERGRGREQQEDRGGSDDGDRGRKQTV